MFFISWLSITFAVSKKCRFCSKLVYFPSSSRFWSLILIWFRKTRSRTLLRKTGTKPANKQPKQLPNNRNRHQPTKTNRGAPGRTNNHRKPNQTRTAQSKRASRTTRDKERPENAPRKRAHRRTNKPRRAPTSQRETRNPPKPNSNARTRRTKTNPERTTNHEQHPQKQQVLREQPHLTKGAHKKIKQTAPQRYCASLRITLGSIYPTEGSPYLRLL